MAHFHGYICPPSRPPYFTPFTDSPLPPSSLVSPPSPAPSSLSPRPAINPTRPSDSYARVAPHPYPSSSSESVNPEQEGYLATPPLQIGTIEKEKLLYPGHVLLTCNAPTPQNRRHITRSLPGSTRHQPAPTRPGRPCSPIICSRLPSSTKYHNAIGAHSGCYSIYPVVAGSDPQTRLQQNHRGSAHLCLPSIVCPSPRRILPAIDYSLKRPSALHLSPSTPLLPHGPFRALKPQPRTPPSGPTPSSKLTHPSVTRP